MLSATIVIPFHNEKKNLEILSNELLNALENKPKDIDVSVIFVNDNSDDGGDVYISKFINKLENFKIINLEKRSGQTGAFKKAFNQCKTDYIIRMDSDLQDNPKDLNLFFNKIILLQPHLIMGIREVRKHRRVLRLASIIYDFLMVLLFNSPLRSSSGSFVCFKKEFVENLPWYKNDHRYLPLITINRGAHKIIEVIVTHRERSFGNSKYSAFNKLFFGIFEVLIFSLRMKLGLYKTKQ